MNNFSTFRKVLKHIDEIRLGGEERHYLIADRFGDVCEIEYFDGKPTIRRGESFKYPILTNPMPPETEAE